jgi:hypothetical protein
MNIQLKTYRSALSLFIILAFPLFVFSTELTKLSCEFQHNPLAINTLQPRFGWHIESEANGFSQSAYELEIKGDSYNWNSGQVISDKSQLVKYRGAALTPGQKYLWRVRIWDQNGILSGWSQWSSFQIAPTLSSSGFGSLLQENKPALGNTTDSRNDASRQPLWIGAIRADSARIPAGKRFSYLEMGSPAYKAVWQNVDSVSRKSICLRKSFIANKPVQEAITYICGLGHYELTINGKKVGDGEFAPFWSDYDKTVYYNTFDITPYLKKGENVFGVLLGNGFFNTQGGRYSKLRVSFGAPTLFFKTIVRYADNSTQEIVSDSSWKYDFSPVTFNDIYGGEDYDARKEQTGWDKPAFNDAHWKAAVIQDAPKGKPEPQQGNPIKIMEYIGYRSLKRLSETECDSATRRTKRKVDATAIVFDMHQNVAGFPQITVNGKKGDRITLIVSESVTPEGAADQRQTGRPHLYTYTLRGNGDETWHPRFSYYGFKYIQVEGAVLKGDKNPHRLPVLKDLKSCFVYNSSQQVSSFECSNDIFNKAHVLIEKAIESNMQAVFTDCPHREKLGWVEQLHLNGPVLMYNYNLASLLPKVMRDLVDGQYPDGAVSSISPMYNIFGDKNGKPDYFGVSPEWGSSILIMPWMYYEFYGDSTIITDNYQSMRRWVDYMTTQADKHVLSFGLGDWYDYGNFRAGFSHNTPVPFVATAYYFYTLKYLVKSALMVGNSYDAKHYSMLANEVRNTLNTKFFDNQTKQYATGSQTANAMAVYMDIVEPENRQAVLNNLISNIQAQGNRLTTGDIGNRYLFQTLATNDLNDLMYLMHNHYDAPGYGFQLKFGATTLTEQWDPRQGASWNHFMLGQIDEWFFGTLAGIQPRADAPGMQHFVIKPRVAGDLQHVNASTETLYGKISVAWRIEPGNNPEKAGNKTFILDISVPANCTAEVYLPDSSSPHTVKSGKYNFSVGIN